MSLPATVVERQREVDALEGQVAVVAARLNRHHADLVALTARVLEEERWAGDGIRSPEHWLDVFRNYYGPLLKAFAALPPAQQSALEDDIKVLINRFNRSGDSSMVVPSEYLEVVVTVC